MLFVFLSFGISMMCLWKITATIIMLMTQVVVVMVVDVFIWTVNRKDPFLYYILFLLFYSHLIEVWYLIFGSLLFHVSFGLFFISTVKCFVIKWNMAIHTHRCVFLGLYSFIVQVNWNSCERIYVCLHFHIMAIQR